MPLRKLIRRIELDARRKLGDALPRRVPFADTTLEPAPAPPSPLFAPRAVLAPQITADTITFRFLNRAIAMPFIGSPGASIDWLAPGLDAASQLWRMNLHYMEFLEGADDAAWESFVAAWIDRNDPPVAGAWRDAWNSYALSLRAVVWMQELERRKSRLSPAVVERAEASLGRQMRFLLDNLETDLGGNHLVKNLKALIWGSAYFRGAEAERWRATGLALLECELAVQIPADGLHYERSPSYHCQVFADLLETRHALAADTPPALDDALARMAQGVVDLAHPDDQVALLNDAGLSMAYAPYECLDVYQRLTGARPAPAGTFAYRDAGYFGLRSTGGFYVVCDCGRIAPDDLPAHGHGDLLSFELSAFGQRFIVDQGVYQYYDGDRRRASRSAAHHNTLSVEGCDQADFFGSFRCGRRPDVTVRDLRRDDHLLILEGSHDGYAHLPGRPIHVRRFKISPGRMTIVDRLEGSLTGRTARVGFLLHPDVAVTRHGAHLRLERGGRALSLSASVPLDVEAAVWWPDMGEEHAASRVVLSDVATGQDIRTEISLT